VVSRIVGKKGGDGIIAHLAAHPGEEDAPPSTAESVRDRAKPDGALLAGLARLREEIRLRPERMRADHRPALSLRPSEAVSDADLVPAAATRAENFPGREAALAFGTAVHRALETVDLSSKPGARDLKSICLRAAVEAGARERAAEVEETVSRALASEVLDRARRSPFVRREVPLQVDLADGTVGGTIDLVFEENGALTVVDYKTDRVDRKEAAGRAEAYGAQLRLYSRALEKATGRAVRRAVLLFTSSGAEFDVDLTLP
jgi:ATP-dependent exoDNAse (exonuclease V) beta subunit